NSLCIDHPVYQPYSPMIEQIKGHTYKLVSGIFTPYGGNFMSGEKADNIDTFSLDFDNYGLIFNFKTESGREETIRFASNGTRFSNLLGSEKDLIQLYLGDCHFEEDILVMNGRWIETCLTDIYTMKFVGDSIEITADNNSAWKFPQKEAIVAKLI
ncbi:MAG: hypothetical protein HUJ56_00460, partial [Erysipelotrichaceae bacterium]|nr:hypothetical protein [Erysipelotrichaceae bacterium]